MRVWDDFLTERDRQVFAGGGYGGRYGFGKRPAVLIVDVTYNFVGDKPEPILESVKRWRHSCGEEGWAAIGCIQQVLHAARWKQVPVIYTRGERRADSADAGVRELKNSRRAEEVDVEGHLGTKIVAEVAPQPDDLVLSKKTADCFFGTPLISYLIGKAIDTVIVTGCTTSGCVRATVVTGQAYNLRMIVVEQGVFDRGQASHAISLWDMQAKYADVVSLDEVVSYLAALQTP